MNDLSGLSWDAAPLAPNGANRNGAQSPFLNIRPSPSLPRQTTPLSAQQSGRSTPIGGANLNSKPAAHDSFSNLLSSTGSKKTNSLSLQERQKQLLEQKARHAVSQQNHFHADDARFWDTLGSGSNTPVPTASSTTIPVPNYSLNNHTSALGNDDDILAAFNSSAPVDRSSHFPPPRTGSAGYGQDSSDNSLAPSRMQSPAQNAKPSKLSEPSLYDDDDPFGLRNMAPKSGSLRPQTVQQQQEDDDDILGMLGKPVPDVTTQRIVQTETNAESSSDDDEPSPLDRNHDAALAELLDMGFPMESSREALAHTSTGGDVQAAVGWLLNKAHEESKSRSRTPAGFESDGEPRGRPARTNRGEQPERSGGSIPAWMRAEAGQQRQGSRSPALGDGDVTQYATEIGSSLYKSANALWRTGQKKVKKTLSEYQDGERDGSQPRWMQTAKPGQQQPERDHPQRQQTRNQSSLTDEAMLLESRPEAAPRIPNRRGRNESPGDPVTQPPQRWRTPPVAEEVHSRSQAPPQRHLSPAQPVQQPFARPADRLRKQVLEEEPAQAYISPARRRKAQPVPVPQPQTTKPEPPTTQLDIFSAEPVALPPRPETTNPSSSTSTPTPRSSTPLPIRPKAPARQIPPVSASALSTSATHRLAGTEAFKRGDYASAQTSYTSALSALPPTHPIAIILLSNRALTLLKTGDPRAAITDTDAALAAIGHSRGEGETISLGGGEAEKPMREFYGKALTRKAEALEHLEKWAEAAAIWRGAVAAGFGGSVSIQGRTRCEKAAGLSTSAPAAAASISRPASAPAHLARKPPPASTALRKPPPTSGLASLTSNGDSSADSDAVRRLRAAHAAATAASDEAFALNDAVSARLGAWKAGKEGNLRALLASLDTVLWAEAGWGKVGMGDLVLPGRVKVVYMKAIARVHPDKLPQSAPTEHKMISAAVFATLNEAWDRFKRDNGL